jgi:hypothetical protein
MQVYFSTDLEEKVLVEHILDLLVYRVVYVCRQIPRLLEYTYRTACSPCSIYKILRTLPHSTNS